MHEVQEYPTSYIAYDKSDWSVIGRYGTIDELIKKVNDYCISIRGYHLVKIFQGHMKSYSVKIERREYKSVDYNIPDPKPRYWYAPYTRFDTYYDNIAGICVTDHLGDVVKNIWDMQTKKPYRSWKHRYEQRDKICKNLKRFKNNVNKIKDVYGYHSSYSHYRDEIDYTADIYTHHRAIATLSNMRKLSGFVKEDGEPEPRGKQRNLPNSWDDVGCNVWHQTKSWKHNSKRRKQWKGN